VVTGSADAAARAAGDQSTPGGRKLLVVAGAACVRGGSIDRSARPWPGRHRPQTVTRLRGWPAFLRFLRSSVSPSWSSFP